KNTKSTKRREEPRRAAPQSRVGRDGLIAGLRPAKIVFRAFRVFRGPLPFFRGERHARHGERRRPSAAYTPFRKLAVEAVFRSAARRTKWFLRRAAARLSFRSPWS